jgi:hypothetical protein
MSGFGLIHRYVQSINQNENVEDAPIGYAIIDSTEMINGNHFLVRTITGRVSKVVEEKSDDPTMQSKTRTILFLDEVMGNEGQLMIVIDTSYPVSDTEHNFGTDGMTVIEQSDGSFRGVRAGGSKIYPGSLISAPFIKPDPRYNQGEPEQPYDLVEVHIIENPVSIDAETFVNMQQVVGQIEGLSQEQTVLLRDELKAHLQDLYTEALNPTDTSVETERLRSVLAAIDNNITLTGSGQELILSFDLNPGFLGEVDPPLNFDEVFEGIDITSFAGIKGPYGWDNAFLLYLWANDDASNSVLFRTLMDEAIQAYIDQTGILSLLNTLDGIPVKIVVQAPDH